VGLVILYPFSFNKFFRKEGNKIAEGVSMKECIATMKILNKTGVLKNVPDNFQRRPVEIAIKIMTILRKKGHLSKKGFHGLFSQYGTSLTRNQEILFSSYEDAGLIKISDNGVTWIYESN
jgi:hypothetical protein